jgi:hypothetical protein
MMNWIWKSVSVLTGLISQDLPAEIGKITKRLLQDSQCVGTDTNRERPLSPLSSPVSSASEPSQSAVFPRVPCFRAFSVRCLPRCPLLPSLLSPLSSPVSSASEPSQSAVLPGVLCFRAFSVLCLPRCPLLPNLLGPLSSPVPSASTLPSPGLPSDCTLQTIHLGPKLGPA